MANVLMGSKATVDVEVALISKVLGGIIDDSVIPFIKQSLKNLGKESESYKGFIIPFVNDIIKPLVDAELQAVALILKGAEESVLRIANIVQLILDNTKNNVKVALKSEMLYALSVIQPAVDVLKKLIAGVSKDASGGTKQAIDIGVIGINKAVNVVLDPVLAAVKTIGK